MVHKLLLPIIIVIASLNITLLGGCRNDKQNDNMLEDITKLIRNEIPVGTKVEHVINFLNKYKIEHSGYLFKKHIIYAICRDSSKKGLVTKAIQVKFFFDDNSRLKSYSFKKVFTGP